MKNAKRLIALLLACCLVLAVCGCSKEEDKKKDASKETVTAKPEGTAAGPQNESKPNESEPTQPQVPNEGNNGESGNQGNAGEELPSKEITYEDIVGVWGVEVDVLEIIKADLLATSPDKQQEINGVFALIPKDSFTIEWYWDFDMIPIVNDPFLTVEYDSEDFDAKLATFTENYTKAVYDYSVSRGELADTTYEAFRQENFDAFESEIDGYMLYVFGLTPLNSLAYNCDKGNVYICEVDEFIEENLVKIKISNNIMTIENAPAVMEIGDGATKDLFPLKLQRVS